MSLPTPYYEQDGITIYHGDCREILPYLPKVDLVLTDPPYGIDWDTNYSRFSRGMNDKQQIRNDKTPFKPRFLMALGEIIMWGANHYSEDLPDGSWLIWDKRSDDGTSFLSDGEIAYWSVGKGVYIKSLNAQKYRSLNGGLHPTQKPVALMYWCIQKAKSQGLILDPFMGSGTTLVAAKQLGRKAIGIEIEEKYCEIAVKRLGQGVLPL